MADTVSVSFVSDSGKEITREVHQTVDIAEFVDCAVYPWLLMAANPHLSAPDLMQVLAKLSADECFRPARWIRKRRWMVQPSTSDAPGKRPNADGNDAQAVRIMNTNPGVSLRDMARLLKEHGVTRSREWIRQRRTDVLE